MSTFKKAKIVMLSTNEAKGDFSKERIYPCLLKYSWMFNENETGKLIYSNSNIRTPTQLQHLYIISYEEKPDNGDYYIIDDVPEVLKNNGLVFIDDSCRKVIATTDNSLLIDTYINQGDTVKGDLIIKRSSDYTTGLKGRINLPQPSQQFIKKFVEEYNKGNIIEDVLVEYEEGKSYSGNEGLIIKEWLKINPKDNTITIKKVKDSWNREEVENLIYSAMKDRCYTTIAEWKKWIKENL